MANVLIDNSAMSAIANAIRSKNGKSDSYLPSEMAEAISAIETGGGLPAGIEMGEFTPASDTETITPITHSLGTVPNYVFIYSTDNTFDSSLNAVRVVGRIGIARYWDEEYGQFAFNKEKYFVVYDAANLITVNSTAQIDYETESSTQFDVPHKSGIYYKGGVTYKWIAINTEISS